MSKETVESINFSSNDMNIRVIFDSTGLYKWNIHKGLVDGKYSTRARCPNNDNGEYVFHEEDALNIPPSENIVIQADGTSKKNSVKASDAVLQAVNANKHRKKANESGSFCKWALEEHIAKNIQNTAGIGYSTLYSTTLTIHCSSNCGRSVDLPIQFSCPNPQLEYTPEQAIEKIPLIDDYSSRTVTAIYRNLQGYATVPELALYVQRLITDIEKVKKVKTEWEIAFEKMLKDADFQTVFPDDRFRRLKTGLATTADEARDELQRKLKEIATSIYRISWKGVEPPKCAECNKTTCAGCPTYENPGV